MYNINCGDYNFFECGRLVEVSDNGIVNVLVCDKVEDSDNLYLFDCCVVDTEYSWLSEREISRFADVTRNNKVAFAVACIDYYGAGNFSNAYQGHLETYDQIMEHLDNFNIDHSIVDFSEPW